MTEERVDVLIAMRILVMRRHSSLLSAGPGAAVLSLALGPCEPADDVAPPPVDAGFDYQIGGDYRPPSEVRVVSRDWFAPRRRQRAARHVAPMVEQCARKDFDAVEFEYGRSGLRAACAAVGRTVSVVLRDRLVSTPGSPGYVTTAADPDAEPAAEAGSSARWLLLRCPAPR